MNVENVLDTKLTRLYHRLAKRESGRVWLGKWAKLCYQLVSFNGVATIGI